MDSSSPRARLLDIGCMLSYLTGVFLRWRYVCVDHDPRKFVVSDMHTYVSLAKRWADPRHVMNPSDVMFPPGAAKVFAYWYGRDPSLWLAVRYQLFVTVLVPLVIFGLGWAAFGKTNGKIALIVSSFYFPFIDYGGYFLSEIPMTLLVAGTVAVFLWAMRQKSLVLLLAGAGAAGALCSLAMAFKFVALPALLLFGGTYLLLHRDEQAQLTRKLKIAAAAAVLVGALPLTGAMTYRCTAGNEGRFCLVSNKGPADFLMGHFGRFELLTWRDGHGAYASGSPSAYQHGYRATYEVNFALTDGPHNSAKAWEWIRRHPGEAVVLSFEHVYDLFCGSMPWPTVAADDWWILAEAFHFAFIAFMLLPVLFLCFDTARARGLRGFLASRELLLASPVIGVAAAVFIATGEPRYRVPFDGFLLVLAIEFYRRYVFAARKAPSANAAHPGDAALELDAHGGGGQEAGSPVAGEDALESEVE